MTEEEYAMYGRNNIMTRIKKMDIYIKGAEGMSEEQTVAFNNLIRGRQEALAISLSLNNQEGPFIAANDQRDAYQKEFSCQVKFRIEIGKFFVAQIPNE